MVCRLLVVRSMVDWQKDLVRNQLRKSVIEALCLLIFSPVIILYMSICWTIWYLDDRKDRKKALVVKG